MRSIHLIATIIVSCLIFGTAERTAATGNSTAEPNGAKELSTPDATTVPPVGDDGTALKEGDDPVKTGRFGPGVERVNLDEEKPVSSFSPARYILSIVMVILFLGGFMFILNKVNHKISRSKVNSGIKVTSRMHLDSKNYLALVTTPEQELLIAVGNNGVSVLNKSRHPQSTQGVAKTEQPQR